MTTPRSDAVVFVTDEGAREIRCHLCGKVLTTVEHGDEIAALADLAWRHEYEVHRV